MRIRITTFDCPGIEVCDVSIVTTEGEQQIQDNTEYNLENNRPQVKADNEVLPIITGTFREDCQYTVTQKVGQVEFGNRDAGVTYRRN